MQAVTRLLLGRRFADAEQVLTAYYARRAENVPAALSRMLSRAVSLSRSHVVALSRCRPLVPSLSISGGLSMPVLTFGSATLSQSQSQSQSVSPSGSVQTSPTHQPIPFLDGFPDCLVLAHPSTLFQW